MDDINKRLVVIQEQQQLSKSQFAQLLQTSLPMITHITQGRNKPGVELLQKVLMAFPEMNAKWLLLGEGEMMVSDNTNLKKSELDEKILAIQNRIQQLQEALHTINNFHKILKDELIYMKQLDELIAQSEANIENLKLVVGELNI
jgi:transcriptional regulator with XRE-family HTH domain